MILRLPACLSFSVLVLGLSPGIHAQTVLAAPGDCAEPSASVVTQPVRALPAAVGGSASEHFQPSEERGEGGLSLTDLIGGTTSRHSSGDATTTSTRLPDGSVVWSVVRSVDAGAVVEPVAEGVVEPIAGGVVEPIAAPIVESFVEPIADPILDPLVEPILEPIVEPILDPIAEPILDPVVEPIGDAVGGLL